MSAIGRATKTSKEFDELKTRRKTTRMTGHYDLFSRYMEKDAEEFFRLLAVTPGTRPFNVGYGAGQLANIQPNQQIIKERNTMRPTRLLLISVAVGLTLIGCQQIALSQTGPAVPNHVHYKQSAEQDKPSPTGARAPRLQNLGKHQFPVTTKSKEAQLFINQGLNLSLAFNHAEAGRAFREASRLDPQLAMAYWGEALVLGPNINAAMDPNNEPKAHELVQKALALKSKASPREQAYIDALAERYSGNAAERQTRDRAYAVAMRKLHERYPDDLDAAVLYAEAMMDLRPWGYWSRDGQPYEGTAEAVSLIEKVIERNPQHPGALHLYIHLMEATEKLDKAEAAADRLLTLMPAAGHMVHMPAHIYQRVGRYADAVRSNELAILADEDYITQCQAQGLYPMAYYPHNVHFLWFAASFDGRSKLAIESARKTASKVPDEVLKQVPLLAIFRVVPYYALTRFGKWDEMLREPAPPAFSPYSRGIWHYARGVAFVAKGQLDAADQELAKVRETLKDQALDQPLFSVNTARAVLSVAPEVLAGEIAAAKKNYDAAIAHLERAVRLEDALVYTEPAEWHYPPRQALGAILLEAGRPGEAETVYWADLKRNRHNGWALFGLSRALREQGKNDEATVVEARFKKSWERADIIPTSSRFGRQMTAEAMMGSPKK
jgi:tetratricopeptide (TPR) repeat protein